jgi:hypothetical protein
MIFYIGNKVVVTQRGFRWTNSDPRTAKFVPGAVPIVCPSPVATRDVLVCLSVRYASRPMSRRYKSVSFQKFIKNVIQYSAVKNSALILANKYVAPSWALYSYITVGWKVLASILNCSSVAYATSLKVSGSIPDYVIGFLNWPNASSRTMALGPTQPLTEMSTRNLPGNKWRPADNPTANCEPIV